MSLLAVGLGLLSTGVAGATGYWMLGVHRRMVRLLDMQTVLRESQATHFQQVNASSDQLQRNLVTIQSTLNALRSIHPEIDASLSAHQFLLDHEHVDVSSLDLAAACTVLSSLVQHQGTSALDGAELSTNHASLLRRLLVVFDQHGVSMGALHLEADTAHRLGLGGQLPLPGSHGDERRNLLIKYSTINRMKIPLMTRPRLCFCPGASLASDNRR